MVKARKVKKEDEWQAALGKNLERQILKNYRSVYDFWVQAIDEDMSRTTLSYIINGRVDVRLSTLKRIADALGLEVKDLVDF